MLDIDPHRALAPAKDAATVILMRDRSAGGFEIFMVRRHGKSGFMGGAYVFPGGKLDPDDSDEGLLARSGGLTPSEAALALGEELDEDVAAGLFVAAIRETFEEAGLLLASSPVEVDYASMRRRLCAGHPFARLCEELDLTLQLDLLVPQARWITPVVESRRFDTRFFLATAPEGQVALHDDRETTEAAWLSPGEALSRAAAGEIQLPPPTMRTLEILSAFDSVDAAVADARSRRPPRVQPVFRDDDGLFVLALPGDPHHPEPEPVLPGGTRFVLSDGRWRSSDG